jgi:hypothetical protein
LSYGAANKRTYVPDSEIFKDNKDKNVKRKNKKVNKINLSTPVPQKTEAVLDALRSESVLRCRLTASNM